VDALNQLITDIKPNESLPLMLPGNAWPELRARRREIVLRACNKRASATGWHHGHHLDDGDERI